MEINISIFNSNILWRSIMIKAKILKEYLSVQTQISQIQQELTSLSQGYDSKVAEDLLKQIQELYDLRKELARYLGDRVVNPKN